LTKVRADLLLVARGLVESRAKARAAIEAGGVVADGRPVAGPSVLVDETAERTVLDVGASTGGFTEVCLARGAARVYAVDVGRGQLHPRLAGDPRVVVLEGTDARILSPDLIPEPPGVVVCDASFIGLAKVLPAALALAKPRADLIALVKPQFEVGPERVGKGGIVKDPAARADAAAGVMAFLEAAGWEVLAQAESPVAGGDGNLEVLLHARKRPPLSERP
jgi:23S rRNA (cytidine1920-2'-O)/16S rRNA (cytidine1409-2'-O)-methyltransferase